LPFVAFFLATLASAQQPPGPRTASPLDLHAYLAELETWTAASERLKEHPEEAATLRRTLPKAWSVAVDGGRFEVSTQWLDSGLASAQKDPQAAARVAAQMKIRLAAMQASAQALESPAELDAQLAHGKLENILKRREFRSSHGPSSWDQWRDRFLAWWADRLSALLGKLHGHPAVAGGFLWTLIAGAVGAFGVWMVRWVLSRPAGQGLDLVAADSSPESWQDLARQAFDASGRGNYRDAVHLAYWAGIHRLEELGLWRAERTRTHREYLCLVPPGHPLCEALSTMTVCFEQVWYGAEAASREDFRFALTLLEKLGCAFPSTPVTVRF
jgi:uncharacterized protein DUF4129